MADYYIDVKFVHSATPAALESAFAGRTQQWGMEETNYAIGVVDSGGLFHYFWPRVNDNIALKDQFLSNDGGDEGISIGNSGAVKLNGSDASSGNYAHAQTGLYRIALIDESGNLVVGTTNVAKNVS
jgi:hypothetical protein